VTLSQRIVIALIKPLAKIFVSWKVKGTENVPLDGPLVVVANHVHLIDPILLSVSFPRWINFMAKRELFSRPFLSIIMRWARAFPVHRQGASKQRREALQHAKRILSQGSVLGMFPEGRRSREGKLLMGKAGAAVIAAKMDTPLLPVGITGTDKLKGISWLWKRPNIVIHIGQPFELPSTDGRLNRSQMKLLTNLMMGEIAALLPWENRGGYQNHGD